ncbi:hypothetical protein [Herbidospora mongoliensis]|uniref:hypothetical protein n=1 Tax=Herbidospora mongoliensis TaxID=688067 RepID=UPI00082F7432|nr:hypothetical protein [Herbidospora mongoliensis]
MTGWDDDDRLLAALRDMARTRSAVPREVVDAAKAAFAWHDVDAELAGLVYDSALDDRLLTSVRGDHRFLIFEVRDLTLEVEVGPEALFGQFLPPQRTTVVNRLRNGETTGSPVDDTGCFVIQPPPPESFSLSWTYEGRSVRTDWVT